MSAAAHLKYLDPKVVSKLKNIEISARLIVEGFITGLHKSPYHGFSVEFAEHRPYNSGESLRNIDWKVFGKTDKLYTKRYEEETNLRCQVVLDISDSMRYPDTGINKLVYGSYLAAALQYLMVMQKDAAGLTLFDDQIRFHAPAKAKMSWLFTLYQELEKVNAQADVFTHRTATPSILHQLSTRIPRRSFVVLITDLFEDPTRMGDFFSALQHLRHEKHEILIFHLLDRETEQDFNLPPHTPVILKDLETGEEIRVLPGQIKELYRERIKAFQDSFRKRCREFRIDFVEADIRQSYDKTLTDYLIKRRTLIG
ncbi:MAG: DUF58 domain-containing protein [Sphingobacteriia bacterium]|nr:DUF58 domain-containing protein [Sphingobacteriia bacterium]